MSEEEENVLQREKKFDVFNPGIYCLFNVCIPIIVL